MHEVCCETFFMTGVIGGVALTLPQLRVRLGSLIMTSIRTSTSTSIAAKHIAEACIKRSWRYDQQFAMDRSCYVTRATLMRYVEKWEDLVGADEELFDVLSSGVVTIEVEQILPLKDAAQVHRDMEARRTVVATILLP